MSALLILSALRGVCPACESEGFAVDALHFRRIGFVSRDPDSIERAIVFAVAMMSALMNGTFDAVVCTFLFHIYVLR